MGLSGIDNGGMGSMFGGRGPGLAGPSAKELEEAQQAVLFKKTVVFESIEIRTYDLSVADEVKAYASDLKALYTGVQAKTHVVLLHDKKFVELPVARWIAHLEWSVYSLKVDANDVLKPAAPVGDTDGKASTGN